MDYNYSLEILPIAEKDLANVLAYIKNELKNEKAAKDLSAKIQKAFEHIISFPLSCQICKTESEYRRTSVDRYIIFYKVDDEKKIVLIYRILHSLMDYEKYL